MIKSTRPASFFIMLLLVVTYRIIVLLKFGIKYTDQDQAVLWEGVKDFANGKFYEPRFYGQAYNTMLESILAVIPYKAGVPVYIAIPAVTTVLVLLPFAIFGWLAYFKRENNLGLLILLLPLLLPLNYDLITSMPRGFVTGIALTSVAMLFYENPKKWKFAAFSFFLVLGYTCNANSILLSLPLFGFYFIGNRKNIWYYIGTIMGLTAGYFICFQMDLFYLHHPEFNLHRPESKFAGEYFWKGLQKTDLFFGDFSPVVWGKGVFTLIVLFSIAVALWIKKRKAQSLIFFGSLVMIFLTLFNSRLFNAEETIFYSYSRMFLAVPLIMAAGIYFLNSKLDPKWIILPAIIFFTLKITLLPNRLETVLENTYIHSAEVENVLKDCGKLRSFAKANDAKLVIVNDFFHIMNNYACNCAVEDFPTTIYPVVERRTWMLRQEHAKIYPTVIVIDEVHHFQDSLWLTQANVNQKWFIVKENKLPVSKLLKRLGIVPREY